MNDVRSLSKFKGGRSIRQTLDYMENLVKAGVDIFDVDIGCYDNWWLPHPPAGMPAGCFLDISRITKEHFEKKGVKSNAGVPVPIVAVGKLGYPDVAEKALRDGMCDMVMLGRPLLADPNWCNKAFAGAVDKICPCIGCQEGCVNEFVEGGHIQCAVNGRTGFEEIIPETAPIAEKPKKIGVIGGGPAGIIVAVNAAKRGHHVELIEKTGKLGGRIVPGSVPAIKFDFANYLTYLNNMVEDARKNNGLILKLNTPVDLAYLQEQKYDSIVFAMGTKNAFPPIPGIDQVKTVQAVELLADPSLLGDAKKVVVCGGGVVGCETAYWLHYEHGREVAVIEMMKNIMQGVCTANRGHLLHYMKDHIELLNCARVTSFEPGKVHYSRNISGGVPNPYNTWQPLLPENIGNPMETKLGSETKDYTIDADLIVLAMGGRPDDALYVEAVRNTAAPEIFNIGDSFAGGRVLEAHRAAFRLSQRI